jgi:hypothetical protein
MQERPMGGMIQGVAAALLALSWSVGVARAQVPATEPPGGLVPEERGPAVPTPPVTEAARPSFAGEASLGPGEINAEALIGRPVVGPDQRPLGVTTDLVLREGEATSLLVQPAGGAAGTPGPPLRVAVDGIGEAADRRALQATDAALADAAVTDPAGERVSSILNRPIASEDRAIAGQIHDLIMDRGFAVTDVVVRLAGVDPGRDVFARLPWSLVEGPTDGDGRYTIDDRARDRLLRFRYPDTPN